MALAGAGGIAGLGLAWLISRPLQMLPLGLEAQSPLTMVAVAFLLAVIATLASVLPAIGVLRIDPAKILRE
jgi:ABC-type antimicrobial peptide transport system permease subunit